VSIDGARPPLPCEGSKGPCTDTSISRMRRAAQSVPGSPPTQPAPVELADVKPPALPGIASPRARNQFGNRSVLHLLAIAPPAGHDMPAAAS
jgi:hypothetical protein